jgi:hypothetical protein
MNIIRSITLTLLSLSLPLVAAADDSALAARVRAATAQYRDINVAIAQGFVPATPCVSGPDDGAMGVHYVMPSRVTSGVLDAEQPQLLIYEPMHNGALRLVGVEYGVPVAIWNAAHPGVLPSLEGNLLNYLPAPNRFGLPEMYYLHLWAWEDNPKGTFADWNTHVTCTKQPVS